MCYILYCVHDNMVSKNHWKLIKCSHCEKNKKIISVRPSAHFVYACQYTSYKFILQEVYKKYLLRTFDRILIRGSHCEKNKKRIICKTWMIQLYEYPIIEYNSNRYYFVRWDLMQSHEMQPIKNILQRPHSKMPASPAQEAKPTPSTTCPMEWYYKELYKKYLTEFHQRFSFLEK